MVTTTVRPAPSFLSRIDRLRSRLSAKLGIRVWYGIGIETWAPLLLRYGHTVSPWQLPRLVLFTLLSALNTFCGLLTRLLFGARIGEVRLHPAPIFVLGHWRTGTTFLHELLSSDPRFIYPRGYQCGAPRLFLLLETTFRPFLNFALPQHRPMDEMRFDLERAQEDEYALLGLVGHSNMRSFIFPAAGPQDADYLSLRALDDSVWLARTHVVDDAAAYLAATPSLLNRGIWAGADIVALIGLFHLRRLVTFARADGRMATLLIVLTPATALLVANSLLTSNQPWSNPALPFLWAFAIAYVVGRFPATSSGAAKTHWPPLEQRRLSEG
jgi:sulfotransferase family protein